MFRIIIISNTRAFSLWKWFYKAKYILLSFLCSILFCHTAHSETLLWHTLNIKLSVITGKTRLEQESCSVPTFRPTSEPPAGHFHNSLLYLLYQYQHCGKLGDVSQCTFVQIFIHRLVTESTSAMGALYHFLLLSLPPYNNWNNVCCPQVSSQND